MWTIFFDGGKWILVLIFLFLLTGFIVYLRELLNDKKKDSTIMVLLLGIVLAAVSVPLCIMEYKSVNEYGKQYTMVVDVYHHNKITRRSFKSLNASISIQYPWRGDMATSISTSKGKVLYKTTSDVEIVSYTYTKITK